MCTLGKDYSVPSECERHPPSNASEFERLNRELIAPWPSHHELDLIRALPVGLSSHLHCGVCRPHSSYIGEGAPLITDVLRLPPLEAHPVLFARKLLALGTFLQGALPTAVKAMETQGFFPRQVMHRVVDVAISLVTTKDELLRSVEAIECIMLEALYHNYSGKLHRAWMTTRRAINVAQSLALHHGFKSPSVKVLEPKTRKDVNLDHLVFRLAEMDGYLSVMLGLEHSSLDTRHITCEKALAACGPEDRMKRIHYIVQERIIARKDFTVVDLAQTKEIDQVLRKAAAEMSPEWWMTPTFALDHTDETKIMHDMIRIMDQFAHYHLLTRLHLPYLLLSDRRYDYNKVVVVNISRELLNRFLSFRASNPAHYYCRGSDFLAFIATTTLCVAHIKNGGDTTAQPIEAASHGTGFEFLAHSRLSDRGLMERTLDVIETMHDPGTDAIASKISRILRDLLAIESSASDGKMYNVTNSKADIEDLECDGRSVDEGKVMRIHISNFGSIDFVKGTVLRTTNPSQTGTPNALSPSTRFPTATGRHSKSPESESTEHQISYPPDQVPATFDPGTPTWQAPNDSSLDMTYEDHNQAGLEFSWPEGDNWDLQGVDIALFDSLFNGSVQVDEQPGVGWSF
ncbi:uncharacterized protein N0V89_008990 [Didymosphaeria variabile]|uniref:Transcription factor domain-containing protein n=1 Tax=Didymosphaeria variabile TaxID=1932322 RepID=A0A9W8XIR6_9PLEO|nr:uncharacterized protein N0V89_008990 [Didymosphaeria variabile]KAJ4350369.1 hypothetical protein N0V89_008990 [Didymosphaeria variabile]